MNGDRPLGRWGHGLYEGLGHLGGLLLAVMTAAVFLQVVLRWLGRVGIEGLDEVPRFLFVWLVMVGAAAAMYRSQHTRLAFFVDRLPRRLQALAHVVTATGAILLFLSLLRTSLVLVPNSQLQRSAGLDLPLGYVYAAMPVGALLILFPLAWQLGRALRDLWQKPS